MSLCCFWELWNEEADDEGVDDKVSRCFVVLLLFWGLLFSMIGLPPCLDSLGFPVEFETFGCCLEELPCEFNASTFATEALRRSLTLSFCTLFDCALDLESDLPLSEAGEFFGLVWTLEPFKALYKGFFSSFDFESGIFSDFLFLFLLFISLDVRSWALCNLCNRGLTCFLAMFRMLILWF